MVGGKREVAGGWRWEGGGGGKEDQLATSALCSSSLSSPSPLSLPTAQCHRALSGLEQAAGAAGPAAPLVAISTDLQPAAQPEGRVHAQAAGAVGAVQSDSAAAPQPHAEANGAAVDKEAAATSAAGAAVARKA